MLLTWYMTTYLVLLKAKLLILRYWFGFWNVLLGVLSIFCNKRKSTQTKNVFLKMMDKTPRSIYLNSSDLTFSKPDGTSILLPKVSINRRHFCFLWGERSNIYLLCYKCFTIYFLHFVLFAWFQRDIFSFFSTFCLNYYILVKFEFVELLWILLFFSIFSINCMCMKV